MSERKYQVRYHDTLVRDFPELEMAVAFVESLPQGERKGGWDIVHYRQYDI
jgi:hypothetical protein